MLSQGNFHSYINVHNSKFSAYDLVKSGHECKSGDENLGDQDTPTECAKACKEKTGCNFLYLVQEARLVNVTGKKLQMPAVLKVGNIMITTFIQ